MPYRGHGVYDAAAHAASLHLTPGQSFAGVGIAPQGVNIQPSIIYISPYGVNVAPQGAALYPPHNL